VAFIMICTSCNKESANESFELKVPLELAEAKALSSYDKLILSHKPKGYWMLVKGYESDASGHGMKGTYHGSGRGLSVLPNGETASVFNGTDNYFEIPNSTYQQVTTTGVLTIEAWMQPYVLNFPVWEKEHYVHWMGKGEPPDNYLWVARMYNQSGNDRPNRISGYCFNLSGGIGVGSYFNDKNIAVKNWINYALIINTKKGYIKIYENGERKDIDKLHTKDINIKPENCTAPVRIATRNLTSFFKGAIGKVAIYDRELTDAELLAHEIKMRPRKKEEAQ
jgi:hypothetical protein